uniref:Uncharacterized protein n=1 Tax=Octopus bimaculoides TaxID=37653 RepID=A0A0L8HGF5_OCTBM
MYSLLHHRLHLLIPTRTNLPTEQCNRTNCYLLIFLLCLMDSSYIRLQTCTDRRTTPPIQFNNTIPK